MRKRAAWATLGLVLAVVIACQKDAIPTVALPEPVEAPEPQAVTPVVITPSPAPSADPEKPASVSANGTVIIRPPDRRWTACVYSAAQVLQHAYGVVSGSNPFDPGKLCGPVTLQLDVQSGEECPATGNGSFDGFKAGRIITLDLGPCECEPGAWEIVSERSDDPQWGECWANTATTEEVCAECRTVTTEIVETNGCRQRDRTETDRQRRPVDCPCRNEGTVTVKADTHVDGSFLYEVRKADGTVVWSAWLPRGAVRSFPYPPNGDTLYLWLRLREGRWEQDARISAECSDLVAAWNERLEWSCSVVCEVDADSWRVQG